LTPPLSGHVELKTAGASPCPIKEAIMTKQEIIKHAKIAFAQSMDLPEDTFFRSENVFVEGEDFEFMQFGNNAVVKAIKPVLDWFKENYVDSPADHIMTEDDHNAVRAKLAEHDIEIGVQDTVYLRLYEGQDIEKPESIELELCDKSRLEELAKALDEDDFNYAFDYAGSEGAFGIAARKNGEVIAIAACEKSGIDKFWNIGIDVHDNYRGQGLATYLLKELCHEIEKRGDLPKYVTWPENLKSIRTAISVGFVPVLTWHST